MSRRIPSISDLNIRSEQPIKRFKTSPTALDPSSYRNIFEQFDDVPPSPTLIVSTQANASKFVVPKASSQQSSATSSSTARSIMTKTAARSTDELWSTLFRPKARQDLIVHPKKVKELEESLQRSCEMIKTNKVASDLSITAPRRCLSLATFETDPDLWPVRLGKVHLPTNPRLVVEHQHRRVGNENNV